MPLRSAKHPASHMGASQPSRASASSLPGMQMGGGGGRADGAAGVMHSVHPQVNTPNPWVMTDHGWKHKDEQPGDGSKKRRRVRRQLRWGPVTTISPTRTANTARTANEVQAANAANAVNSVNTVNSVNSVNTVRGSDFDVDRRPQSPHFPLDFNARLPPHLDDKQIDLQRHIQIIGKSVQGLITKTKYYKSAIKNRAIHAERDGSPISVGKKLVAIIHSTKGITNEKALNGIYKKLFYAVKDQLLDHRTLRSWQVSATEAKKKYEIVSSVHQDIQSASEELAAILRASKLA